MTSGSKLYDAMCNLSERERQWMYLLGKDDNFATHRYSFGGLNDIYESFMLDIAGACRMPVTRLFGQAPAGMNATGESDMENYYETVQKGQETYFAPVIDKLLTDHVYIGIPK
ncbi:anti-CBASS protein Acb1 family protein [Paenibacillus elgii]|uniref:anti-CBASS protein Acb1 family protein n=1 Tax=Paenibacillus elgii TaxID=189691 RepID=UPI001CB8AF34|nr:anti-CBASS Acb1 family protein [Paenibacillus elgii]